MAAHSGKNWAPKGISVWLVTYDHRHGVDHRVYGSEERALHGALAFVMENLEDLRDQASQKEIKALFAGGQLQEALDFWQVWWQDSGSIHFQSIDIERLEVE